VPLDRYPDRECIALREKLAERHGLFANDALRRAWLRSLGWRDSGGPITALDSAFDHLADVVESHLDMAQLEAMIGL